MIMTCQAYLMVLSDILQLAQSPEYSSHPKQQPEELVSVTCYHHYHVIMVTIVITLILIIRSGSVSRSG